MKKKNLFLAALTAVALVGCTNDDFSGDIGDVNPPEQQNVPIVFSSAKSNVTRADLTGADAAEKLGYAFVVSGYKGSQTEWDAADNKIVFDNYLVEWEENTANTTESNSSNWEYVGKGLIKHAEDNGITQQTIKYWDYSKDQYDFIAWSTGSKTAIYEEPTTGIPAGSVLVSAITPTTATGEEGTATAYTFQGSAADLSECYIADLVTVKKDEYGDNPVVLKFRQLGTKVRIGIYETVPGYSVKDVKFYTTGDILEAVDDNADPRVPKDGQIVDDATIFSAGADIYTEGTYTVYFPTVDDVNKSDNNLAHVSFDATTGNKTTIVNWSGLDYTIRESGESETDEVYLGRSSNTASFAGDPNNNYYVVYLPNESGANLNLRINFTLESIDGSGEIIEVKNAKAQVPSIYTTWKPGFAYTYLFKISDKTNGRTGVYDPTQADDATINSDPAGLYPITFDAVVVNAEEDGTQETITTVMTPSITTYQQKSTVVNADEYTANGNDIFVTVNEGDALVTMTNENPIEAGDAALYIIEDGMTEAEVVDALTYQDDDAENNTIKGRSGKVLREADFTLTNSVEFGADGNAITVQDDQALRFTPATGNTYAFVYTKTIPTTTEDKFQPITKAAGDNVEGLYRFDYKNPATTDAQKGVKYFTEESGVYTLVEEPFIGQGVGNLYLNDGGTQIASGYAVTGTDYYYTTDNGQTYTKAHNVAWAENCLQGLYEEDTTPGTYKATEDTLPQDGKAYYYLEGGNYIYCVFTPQQTTGWKELDETADKVACATGETAIDGQTYFDKYTKNNGEYYTKVIKVQ